MGEQSTSSQGSCSKNERACGHKEVTKTSQQIKLNSADTTKIGPTLC